MDNNGNRITDKAELCNLSSNYFKNLYSEDGLVEVTSFPIHGAFPRLNQTLFRGMDVEVTYEEVKETVFSMGALKAPGPNGFHDMFYQSQWDIIGETVYSFVKGCFQDPF